MNLHLYMKDVLISCKPSPKFNAAILGRHWGNEVLEKWKQAIAPSSWLVCVFHKYWMFLEEVCFRPSEQGFTPSLSRIPKTTVICVLFAWILVNSISVSTFYFIRFEITDDPYYLIGSQQCNLFTNRTCFCSKSHLFPSQWEWNIRTKQPIRFQDLLLK